MLGTLLYSEINEIMNIIINNTTLEALRRREELCTELLIKYLLI